MLVILSAIALIVILAILFTRVDNSRYTPENISPEILHLMAQKLAQSRGRHQYSGLYEFTSGDLKIEAGQLNSTLVYWKGQMVLHRRFAGGVTEFHRGSWVGVLLDCRVEAHKEDFAPLDESA